jgi:hypothetical protein
MKSNILFFGGSALTSTIISTLDLASYYDSNGWKVGIVFAHGIQSEHDKLLKTSKVPLYYGVTETDPVSTAQIGIKEYEKMQIIIVSTEKFDHDICKFAESFSEHSYNVGLIENKMAGQRVDTAIECAHLSERVKSQQETLKYLIDSKTFHSYDGKTDAKEMIPKDNHCKAISLILRALDDKGLFDGDLQLTTTAVGRLNMALSKKEKFISIWWNGPEGVQTVEVDFIAERISQMFMTTAQHKETKKKPAIRNNFDTYESLLAAISFVQFD